MLCVDHASQPMETDDSIVYRPRSSKLVGGAILPELDAFLHLLIVLRLLDCNNLDRVSGCETLYHMYRVYRVEQSLAVL